MKEPRDLVAAIESRPALPDGAGDRFSGYGIIGLPFASGHILALRRFTASSVGPGYTSVWHRDPGGRWTFCQDVAPNESCPRYFGKSISENIVAPIRIEWTGPRSFQLAVGAPGTLDWQVTLAPTLATRTMNAAARLMPEFLWQQSAVLSMMGIAARATLGTGDLRLSGRTPNGQAFVANPRIIWCVAASRAVIGGRDLGRPGPLAVQARLRDFVIPQRGIFATVHSFLEPAESRTAAA